MTVSSATSSVTYNGDDSTTTFAVGFAFLDNSHVVVIHRDSDGVETTWVENTHYTITGSSPTANIEVDVDPTDNTPATGETLTTLRTVPLTQVTDYVANDPFPAETHEAALDKLTMIAQQLDRSGIDKAVRISDTVTDSPTLTITELAATRADKVIGFNAAGDEIELHDNPTASQTAAAASAAASALSETAAETAETNAETAETNAAASAASALASIANQNLLTNSGFEIWSNSGLTQGEGTARQSNFAVATIYADVDGTTGATWTTQTLCSLSDGGDHLLLTATGTGSPVIEQSLSDLTPGKLYKFSAHITNGTGSLDASDRMMVYTTGNSEITRIATPTSDEDYSIIWEAQGATDKVRFVFGLSDTQTIQIKTIYVEEVTPGCVADGTFAMDGWHRNTAQLDIYRQHNDSTYTKNGSFYSLKVVKETTAQEILCWPSVGQSTALEFAKRFAGRTMTFGCWVYSVGADDSVKLYSYDGASHTTSASFAGADAWEWMEMTVTFSATATQTRFGFSLEGDTSDIAYISQPMLVFGNSIGEGNYTRPQGEVINLESYIDPTSLAVVAVTGSTSNISLEADTAGKLSKGTASFHATFNGEASAYNDSNLIIIQSKTSSAGIKLHCGSAGEVNTTSGSCVMAADGKYDINYNGGTWSGVYLRITEVTV